jgi:hypothetical protein
MFAGMWILLRCGSLASLFPCHIYNPLISRINAHLLNSTYQLYNMTDKKTIVVLGATGNQGGSVVNALLQDSQ